MHRTVLHTSDKDMNVILEVVLLNEIKEPTVKNAFLEVIRVVSICTDASV